MKKNKTHKYLHLIPNEKFTEPFIQFVNKNFIPNDQLFLIIGNNSNNGLILSGNVEKISKDFNSLFLILKEMHRCEKIIFHSLFFKEIVLILFIQPWFLKKSNWVIWGADLYCYNFNRTSLKSKINEHIRRFVIKHIGGLITHVKGDYELAKMWYGARGKYFDSFMYPSNLYKEYNLDDIKKDKKKIFILVGNSADMSNNHLEVFEKLEKYKNENIEIVCPLSYGNVEYRDKVLQKGTDIFGSKLKSMIDFMPFDKYLDLLAKIDVAIFNHDRQQAMGNITTLLGLGKKVYIRDDITTWGLFDKLGIKLYRTNEEIMDLFLPMTEEEKSENVRIVKNNFCEEKLVKDLSLIFS